MDTKIFDTLLEPVFVINTDKKVQYCNEPASLIAGVSIRKLMRSQASLESVFTFSEPVNAFLDLSTLTEPSSYQEVAFTTEDQKAGKVQITVQPFHDSLFLVYFRDVTLEETLQKKYRAELEQKEDVIKDLQVAQAELQNYSKNLERMVEERTAEVRKLNQLMAALLDSLKQGFFIFDQSGKCLEVFSKACRDTLGTEPVGKNVWEVLALSSRQVPGFQKWLTTVFAEMLPFEDLAPLGPQSFPHPEGKHVKLEYYPLRAADSTIAGVVVVATDITELIQAQEQAETDRARSSMILKLIESKKQALSFLSEAEILLHELQQEVSKPEQLSIENTFRLLHTLKGGAASFSIKALTEKCHQAESLITTLRSETETTRRKQLLEQLRIESASIFSEYEIFTKENVAILGSPEKRSQRFVELPTALLEQFAAEKLKQIPTLQSEFIENFLTETLHEQFQQYEEVVANTAEIVGKQVHPILWKNKDLRITPKIYGGLISTFVHVFRNAVDHGIETAEIRVSQGKPAAGRIEVAFEKTKDGKLKIQVKDDGGGIPAEKIRAKLEQKGLSPQNMSDFEVIQHVFDSQLSTKDSVSDISGRGVGLDAVLNAAKKLGGTAWVESTPGLGTTLTVEVPFQVGSTNPKAA